MNNWDGILYSSELKSCREDLHRFLDEEYSSGKVFPPREDIFRALELTGPEQVRAVILGQDPYHDDGQAHGLAFSVGRDVKIPPSRMNIYKELNSELGLYIPDNGNLEKWARQGVLLLNTVLTVRAHEPNSHRKKGWETVTDALIRAVNDLDHPVVFMLWGAPAISKKKLITNPSHLILEAPHPSPLSVYRGFFGCGHFKKCNEFLAENGYEPIDWQIEDVQQRLLT